MKMSKRIRAFGIMSVLVGTAGLLGLGEPVLGGQVDANLIHEIPTKGESLVPLKLGETRLFSYGLYFVTDAAATNPPVTCGFLLVLRNIGAKSITMTKVTESDFALVDSRGRQATMYLWGRPRTIGFNEATVAHLMLVNVPDVVQPWTLRFHSKPDAFVQFDLNIPGIRIPERSMGKRSGE